MSKVGASRLFPMVRPGQRIIEAVLLQRSYTQAQLDELPASKRI